MTASEGNAALLRSTTTQGCGVVQRLGRLRLRLGKNYPGSGSRSGSEQNVPAALALAPGMRSRANLGRLRLRLGKNYPGSGSRSGSEQNVSAAPAPTPHPCYIVIQELLNGSPPPPPLCLVRGPALTFFNYCSTSPSRNCLPAVFALCRVRSQANICCRTQSDV